MFTGIVEELGEVVRLDWYGEGAVLHVRAVGVTTNLARGDSVAVNGVCLTVVDADAAGGVFTADVMKETFDRSTLGSLGEGDAVNLERAATLSTRLGGHLVQGHVDGVGSVVSRVPGARWDDVRVRFPRGLGRYIVEKGSISIDGVSLTVVAVDGDELAVSLIPTTLELTTLGRKSVGAQVNLEVDVIAKYVEKLMAAGTDGGGGANAVGGTDAAGGKDVAVQTLHAGGAR
jgi:riboflavin synthase